jgi:NAD(P) transhydrogenase subunit alpha
VLVIGAGVAGLQAIATAKRLGAAVEGYDVRSAAREQVESLGAKFVDTGVSADGAGGYARELSDEEKAQQRAKLAAAVARADVVITTAAVPGKRAPVIVDAEMASGMLPGSVVVDLAAEQGGNCALTRPGETVRHGPVTVTGPVKLPSRLPVHASDMLARNLANLLLPFIQDGVFTPDWADDVLAGTVLTRDGQLVHEGVRKVLNWQNP